MKQKLDHHHAAQEAADLDLAYHALVRIGRRRGRLDPVAGTIDRALVDAFEALHQFRALADAASVAAGSSSPFVRRDMKAGAELQAQARALRLAQLEEEERVLEERRRRTWWGTPTPPVANLLSRGEATGDGDGLGSPHNSPGQGPSAATPRAGADIASNPSHPKPSPTDAADAR